MIGGLLVVGGMAIGIYIVKEWLNGITHIPLTVLATLLIVIGIQMFVFTILSNLIVSLHKERMSSMHKIQKDFDKS